VILLLVLLLVFLSLRDIIILTLLLL